MTARNVLLALLLAILILPSASAEIYSYEDGSGTMHFVDDASKIPKHLKKRKRVVDAAPAAAPAPTVTGVRISNNQVLVPATLHYNGRVAQATFLLDTGANSTTISYDLAERLGVRGREGQAIYAQVAGGGVVMARRVQLERMDVGPNSRFNLDVDIMRQSPNMKFDGLLGMNFLRNFHYIIDFHESVIRWQ